jgi:hypothetical protein
LSDLSLLIPSRKHPPEAVLCAKQGRKKVKHSMSVKSVWWHCISMSVFRYTTPTKTSETLLSSLITSINNKVRFVKISHKKKLCNCEKSVYDKICHFLKIK